MWAFTLRMIPQTGCRELRPVGLEYLRRIVLKSDAAASSGDWRALRKARSSPRHSRGVMEDG